jgi:hypothetical protein
MVSIWSDAPLNLKVANASNAAAIVRVLFENRISGKPELASSELQIGPMSQMSPQGALGYGHYRDLNYDKPGLSLSMPREQSGTDIQAERLIDLMRQAKTA